MKLTSLRLHRPRLRITAQTAFMILGALCLAILFWVAAPLVSFAGKAPLAGRLSRILVMLLILSGVVLYAVARRRRSEDRNQKMLSQMAQSLEAEPAEDLSAEDLAAIKERAESALTVMRTRRVGKDKELIYELPWYLVLGPPGAGKTTAIHNAGLTFPAAQELGAEPVVGLGGTRTCEWWFTDEAVLIDTAGRYTTQDSHKETDSKAWTGFLDLLKRYRPRQPLTGLIVALSAGDLVAGDEREITAHARAVRLRINEVATRLGVRAPVYVVVTKMDLLAGFSEFFDALPQRDRDQVWGHTFAVEASREGQVSGPPLRAALDALAERLAARIIPRLQGERDVVRRGAVFAFPQQFATLLDPLSRFVAIIGRETKFEPSPLVRGVYFSSATQFGRPIDKVLAAVAARFGVAASGGVAQTATGRSYFLRDVLTQVVFGEAALAGRDPKGERRRRWIRIASLSGAALTLIVCSAAWMTGYARSAALVHALQDRSRGLQTAVDALPAGSISDSDLKTVLPVLDEARALPFASTAPAPSDRPRWTFGVSRTRSLRAQVDAAYGHLLNRQMLPRLLLDLEDQLRSALRDGDQKAGRQRLYAVLRIYLMLGRSPGAPLQRGQIEAWYAGAWDSRYAGAEDDGVREALQKHLASLLGERLEPPALDSDLIRDARTAVRSLTPGERSYSQLLADPALADLPQFALSDVPGLTESGLFTRKSGKSMSLGVPGVFRRQAFFTVVVPGVAKAAALSAGETWVTGEKPVTGAPGTSQIGMIKDQMLEAYLKDFTAAWDGFIGDIAISSDHTPKERIAIAVAPPSPVKSLITALANETNLTPPSLNMRGTGGMAGALRVGGMFSHRIYTGAARLNYVNYAMGGGQAASGPPGPLDDVIAHFRWLEDMNPPGGPSPVDAALQALAAVRDSALSAQSTAALGDPLLQKTKTGSAMEATAKLDQTASTLPPVVKDLFTGFVRASASALNASVKQSIEQQYAAELLPQCQLIVRQGFPFDQGGRDAPIDDVSRLLRPGGLVDAFVQTNLTGMIDASPQGWSLSPAGKALGLHAASLQALQAADRIKRRMFQPGEVRPATRFLIEPVQITSPAGSVTLVVDGQPASFDQANRRAVELRWPGASPGVTITFPKASGSPTTRTWNGDFALARMLRSAKILSSTTRATTFQVSADDLSAVFTLRFSEGENPFDLQDFERFRCPQSL